MDVAWETVIACAAAIGSIISSVQTIRLVMRHEREACDQRLEAFQQGLNAGRHE